jgi:hypothetical protein
LTYGIPGIRNAKNKRKAIPEIPGFEITRKENFEKHDENTSP